MFGRPRKGTFRVILPPCEIVVIRCFTGQLKSLYVLRTSLYVVVSKFQIRLLVVVACLEVVRYKCRKLVI